MTKIDQLYRRIGIVSALGLSGWLAGSAGAQQPTVAYPVGTARQVGQPLPEPVSTTASTDPTDGSSRYPSAADGDCDNYNLAHRWECHWLPALRETHWGYPEEFIKRPLGSQMYGVLGAQVASGQAARMVLYQYDFQNGELNVYGRRRALRILDCMRMVAAPVVIEPSGDENLDHFRRESVIGFLQQNADFAIVPVAVVIADPAARPLSGPDAVRINANLLKQTQTGGATYTNPNNAIGTQTVSPGAANGQ